MDGVLSIPAIEAIKNALQRALEKRSILGGGIIATIVKDITMRVIRS